jgi:hypothetical protein
MTVETIIEHNQPGSEPGDPPQQRQADAGLAADATAAGSRTLALSLGIAVAGALVILDALPLNWAAQAFGLDSAGTWLVRFILVAVSIGAMLGFELTRRYPRRRGVLAAAVTRGQSRCLGSGPSS